MENVKYSFKFGKYNDIFHPDNIEIGRYIMRESKFISNKLLVLHLCRFGEEGDLLLMVVRPPLHTKELFVEKYYNKKYKPECQSGFVLNGLRLIAMQKCIPVYC